MIDTGYGREPEQPAQKVYADPRSEGHQTSLAVIGREVDPIGLLVWWWLDH
jgi:hypothetical protein